MQQNYISSKTRLLALVGNPARHSLSPIIQNQFLADNNIDGVYVTFEFPADRLENALSGARDLGIYGLNITMPYKGKAFEFSDNTDEYAKATEYFNKFVEMDPENPEVPTVKNIIATIEKIK